MKAVKYRERKLHRRPTYEYAGDEPHQPVAWGWIWLGYGIIAVGLLAAAYISSSAANW